jgi:sRNA-binding protein
MTIAQHNARTMYKQNDTRGFIQSGVLTEADMKYIRKEARRVDASGQERQMRTKQAEHDQQAAEDNRKKDAAKKEKADAREAELDGLIPHLDAEWLKTSGRDINTSHIMREINWHRRYDASNQIPSKTLIRNMKKDDKLTQLIIAVERYNTTARSSLQPPLADSANPGVLSRTDWEEADTLEDADMED